MGNFSGVTKILWVFVPLIFMGLWMAVKSEWAWYSGLPESLGCAGRWEGLGPEQGGTEKACTLTLYQPRFRPRGGGWS